jgi:polyisoprenyl-teichoic acid--peptidoglycan teichoic acid transferase
MPERFDDFDLPPPPPPGREGGFNPRLALFTFAFTTFVLGGFVFGWLFLANWKLLTQFRTTEIRPFPGGPMITIPAAPDVAPIQPPRAANPTPALPAPAGTAVAQAPELPEWTGQGRINVLLLGIDHRDDEPIDGSRSDTIMVVSIDPPTRAVVMISLPRDLWVSIPGHYNQRINAAHAAGGPSLVARTVEANFGIPIRYFARIDFRGFEQIVDAIGGVIIDVERTIKDDEYPTEDYGIMRLFIPPGPQLMDGKLALQYARSRHSENDFGRARRQQRLLVAMRDRGLQLNILPKVPSLIGLVQRALQTDVPVTDMLRLARLGSQIERDRIKSVVVDASLADPFIGPLGEDLLLPNRVAINRAVTRAFAEATGQTAKIEVFNGTSRPGLAGSLANRLANAGYEVVRIADADHQNYAETTLFLLSDNRKAAEVLAGRLQIRPDNIQVATDPDSDADVRIVVGRNQQP